MQFSTQRKIRKLQITKTFKSNMVGLKTKTGVQDFGGGGN
jgi:hypothetical protein